jgi:hypothetical protein
MAGSSYGQSTGGGRDGSLLLAPPSKVIDRTVSDEIAISWPADFAAWDMDSLNLTLDFAESQRASR